MGDKVTYTKNVEWSNDHQGKEQGVVVKDAKSGSFIFGYLIFLPQNPFIFLLTRDLLVTRIQLKYKNCIYYQRKT